MEGCVSCEEILAVASEGLESFVSLGVGGAGEAFAVFDEDVPDGGCVFDVGVLFV